MEHRNVYLSVEHGNEICVIQKANDRNIGMDLDMEVTDGQSL